MMIPKGNIPDSTSAFIKNPVNNNPYAITKKRAGLYPFNHIYICWYRRSGSEGLFQYTEDQIAHDGKKEPIKIICFVKKLQH